MPMTTPKEALEQIAARSIAQDDDDEKELRRQLYHIESLAKSALASFKGDAVERVTLPPIPDDDADFTPDLARKIIAKYPAILAALTEARAEIERQADTIRLLDERCAQYERRAEQAERALSVLAPVRDMLILCGELGGMQPGETMADYLRRLIDEVAGVKSLRARVREVVGLFVSTDLLECKDCVDNDGKHYQSQWLADALRVARQLMEEVK